MQNHSELKTQPAALPRRLRLGYGAAETGIVAVELLIQLYLLKFFTSVVGLRAELAGAALALAVFIDAVSDPLMGNISDGTRSPLGRRRVYILIGSVALAVLFPLLFHPPHLDTQWGRFLFLLAAYSLVNIGMTILAVPHAALGGELSSDPDVRTEIYGFRLLFGNLGLLLGTLVPGTILALRSGDPAAQGASRSEASLVVAGVVLLSGLITFYATRGRDVVGMTGETRPIAFLTDFHRSLFQVLRNRVFLPLLIAFFAATVGRTINSSLALLYYEHTLRLKETDVILYVLGLFILVITGSILFWVLVSRRYGKKWPAFLGIVGLGTMTAVAYPLFPAGSLVGPLVAAVVGGFLVGSVVLLDALVADIVDYDAVHARRSREGLYFGMWKMSAKTARAVGLALSGFALGWAGFDEAAPTQSPETGRKLALLFGPGVAVFFLLGAGIFATLPWSRAIHERVRRILARRQSAVDV